MNNNFFLFLVEIHEDLDMIQATGGALDFEEPVRSGLATADSTVPTASSSGEPLLNPGDVLQIEICRFLWI